jgi:hypothetical protein
MLTFIQPWVFVVVSPVALYLWGWITAVLDTAVIPLWSMMLADILLVRFRKVPFTCCYPPFRHSAIVVLLVYFFGFTAFVGITSSLEHSALLNPPWMLLFIPIGLGAWYARSRFRRDAIEIDKQLIFEEKQPADFEVLNLAHCHR